MELPEEDKQPGMCGRLNKAMYGTRDAAQNWEEEYAEFMMSLGFKGGKVSPCVFYNEHRNIRVVVHGGDFTCLGYASELDWLRTQFANKFTVKFKARIGPQVRDDKSVQILNRIIMWKSIGIEYEPDQRHAEIMVDELGLRGKKSLSTPGVKVSNEKDEPDDEEPLTRELAEAYRSVVARGNYLSQDRLDIRFTVKELNR